MNATAMPMTPGKISRDWGWPAMIVGLLGLEIVLCFIGYTLANADRSFAVESDYYKRALEWDRENGQNIASTKLNWKTTITVGPNRNARGKRTVTLILLNAQGLPVDGAVVKIRCFHHARSSEIQEATLLAQSTGLYSAEFNINRGGLWEYRIHAQRGADIFTPTLQQEWLDQDSGVLAK